MFKRFNHYLKSIEGVILSIIVGNEHKFIGLCLISLDPWDLDNFLPYDYHSNDFLFYLFPKFLAAPSVILQQNRRIEVIKAPSRGLIRSRMN